MSPSSILATQSAHPLTRITYAPVVVFAIGILDNSLESGVREVQWRALSAAGTHSLVTDCFLARLSALQVHHEFCFTIVAQGRKVKLFSHSHLASQTDGP